MNQEEHGDKGNLSYDDESNTNLNVTLNNPNILENILSANNNNQEKDEVECYDNYFDDEDDDFVEFAAAVDDLNKEVKNVDQTTDSESEKDSSRSNSTDKNNPIKQPINSIREKHEIFNNDSRASRHLRDNSEDDDDDPHSITSSMDHDRNERHKTYTVCYEQLGAPVLIYRNFGSYTIHDEKPVLRFGKISDVTEMFIKNHRHSKYYRTKLSNMGIRTLASTQQVHDVSARSVLKSVSDFITSSSRMNRACAKYYYPMNYPYFANPSVSSKYSKTMPNNPHEPNTTIITKKDDDGNEIIGIPNSDDNEPSDHDKSSTVGQSDADKIDFDHREATIDLQSQNLLAETPILEDNRPSINIDNKLPCSINSTAFNTNFAKTRTDGDPTILQGFRPDFVLHQNQLNEKRSVMLYDSIPKFNVTRQEHAFEARRAKVTNEDHQVLDSCYYVSVSNKRRRRQFRLSHDNDNKDNNSGRNLEVPIIRPKVLHQTSMYERQRINRSDSSYLAPFLHNFDLLEATFEDYNKCHVNSTSSKMNKQLYKKGVIDVSRQEVSPLGLDQIHSPIKYGNCIQLVTCGCPYCSKKHNIVDKTQCLLHPVGPLLETVQLSFLGLPRTKQRLLSRQLRQHNPDQLMLDDRIRQIVRCGDARKDLYNHMFIARTDLHCTVFQIHYPTANGTDNDNVSDDLNNNNCCYCKADLIQLYRIDHRKQPSSIERSIPTTSYVPIDIASHPMYGNQRSLVMWSDANIAIAYENHTTKERNIIHHISANEHTLRNTGKHIIRNLQSISCLNFTLHHPMVLWSASQSYVRPALAGNILKKYQWMGHGTSLYSIDLRTEQGTFQWSPSHESYLREGIHSISGIQTDWDNSHRVWVSSTSAGKTWEIDSRMPCQVVTTWSLPYIGCDDCGSRLPPTAFHGAGTLFVQPYHCQNDDHDHDGRTNGGTADRNTFNSKHLPILSVGKSPETAGIHIYYRPEANPRFRTNHVECVADPGLQKTFGEKHNTLAKSSIIMLPDVSQDVFTCGLAAFRTKVDTFATSTSALGFSSKANLSGLLVVLSMTNKGDLYSYAMAENTSAERLGQTFEGLPVGTSVIPIEENFENGSFARNVLCISLSNTFPIPSKAIQHTQKHLNNSDNPVRHLKRLSQEQMKSIQNDDDKLRDDFMVNSSEFPSCSIRPKTVVVFDNVDDNYNTGNTLNLQIRKSLLVDQHDEISKTLSNFDTARRGSSQEQMQSPAGASGDYKTDLTNEVLNVAWPDTASSNDDDSDND